jgi:hypothetical protein
MVICFTAKWDQSTKATVALYDRLSADFHKKTQGIKFYKSDIDKNQDLVS